MGGRERMFPLAVLFGLLLAGCGSSSSGSGNPAVSGTVLGGGSPVSGSTVTLNEAGNSAGGAATLLATTTTDANGRFSFTFANPGGSRPLYLIANGGNAGNGTNPAIQLGLMLGPADGLPSSPVTINEATSVALVYPMSLFIQASSNQSVSGASPALQNAAGTSARLVNPASGAVQTALDTNAQNTVGGLADILASCVGGSPANCTTLFAAAAPPGGSPPSNSLGALLAMAENPTNNVPALWALISTSPPFPTSPTAPSSLSVSLSLSGGGVDQPSGIAMDGSGALWVTNYAGNSVTQIPNGLVSCASGCLNFAPGTAVNAGPIAIAVDGSGNLWTANFTNNSVTEIPPGSTSCASGCTIFTGPSLSQPSGIAIDKSGNVWVSNYVNNMVTEIPKGSTSCASGCIGFSGANINHPVGIGVDGSGNVWIANFGSASVTEIPAGAADCSSACNNLTGANISAPIGLALDGAGNVWVVNSGNGSVTRIPAGSASCSSGCTNVTGGGLNRPQGIAVDAAGNLWVSNLGDGSVTEISKGALSDCSSGCVTYNSGGLPVNKQFSGGIALDASGNVWAANTQSAVTEIIGVAAPIHVPLIGPPLHP